MANFGRKKKGGLSFYNRERKVTEERIWVVIGYAFWPLLAVLLAYMTVSAVGIKTTMVGNSMEPALFNGQDVLVDVLQYKLLKPKRGDVLVFKPNGNENSYYYIKRVVGVPGDTIQITNGVLILNGEKMPSLFSDKIADPGVASNVFTIPDDEYFVMGDNCNNSEDSRSANLGNVKKDTIYGKAWFCMAAESSGLGFIR
jgi:signal peptidase I